MLKALAAKNERMNCSSFVTFPGVGGYGITVGRGGGGRRFRQPQAAFETLGPDRAVADMVGLLAEGKSLGRTRMSFSAFSDNRQPWVLLAKYMI